MQRIIRFVPDHWNGRLSPPAALAGPLLGVTLVLHSVLGHLGKTGAVAVPLLLLTAGIVLVWQMVGAFRAMDRQTGQGMAWCGYAGMLVVAMISAAAMIGLALPAQGIRPAPRAETPAAGFSRSGNTATLNGTITLAHFAALEALVETGDPPVRFTLNSNGGNVHAARGLARLVEENGISTRVAHECLSACTLVFVAGTRRELGPGASLGFHAWSTGNTTNRALTQFLDIPGEQQKDREFFRRHGVRDAFLARMFEADPSSIWRPARAELVAAGIVPD